jgi:hypothetical protein
MTSDSPYSVPSAHCNGPERTTTRTMGHWPWSRGGSALQDKRAFPALCSCRRDKGELTSSSVTACDWPPDTLPDSLTVAMPLLGKRTLARLLPGVLAALLAGSLCAPSDARAGCEHRPFLGDGPIDVTLPAGPNFGSGQAADRTQPATPCRGPGCSRGPQQAPATPPAPAPRDLKPRCTLAGGRAALQRGLSHRRPLPTALPAARPPRRRHLPPPAPLFRRLLLTT